VSFSWESVNVFDLINKQFNKFAHMQTLSRMSSPSGPMNIACQHWNFTGYKRIKQRRISLKKIYFTVSSNLVISVDIFWAEIYRGRLFFRAEWVEIISPIEIRIHHFLSGKNNNTLHKIDTSQTVYRMFFFFVQLNNYISNLSLLKYFIQKIYGKRDISQQVVTLSKFGNARIWYYEKF
jgi:hypothetical protein